VWESIAELNKVICGRNVEISIREEKIEVHEPMMVKGEKTRGS